MIKAETAQQDGNYSSLRKSKGGNPRKLMLFDLLIGGHHGSYIQHLVDYWTQQRLASTLDIVVSPAFLEKHADIVTVASEYAAQIRFVAITPQEVLSLKASSSRTDRMIRIFQEWQLLCRYAHSLEVNHCLIMYLDTCWLPITLGMKLPCPFSGIYFRPTLHYSTFPQHVPTSREPLQQMRERFALTQMLRHPQLHTLFTLDQFSIQSIQHVIERVQSQATVVHLPDPIQISQSSTIPQDVLRKQLGINPNRKIFLLFGVLNGRKGIDLVLEAISLLPQALCQQICLVLLGEGDPDQLGPKVSSICQSKPIQVIEQYQFLPDAEVRAYFELADIVLATYQRHIGMSGILLWAAAVQKPVLSTDYGLMGELVRQYSLGLTVDSASPEAIAQGLTRCLQEPAETLGDRSQMKIFAQQNSAKKFANVILKNLLDF